MNLILILLALSIILFQVQAQLTIPGASDKGLKTHEVIQSRGFIPEFHNVISNDGYYIGIHRMIHAHVISHRQSVLFLPVAGGSSVEWLRNSPGGNVNEHLDKVGPNIGFELAKRGFDVWLMDNRGTYEYSYNHTVYNIDHDQEYWGWSSDEIAFFDIPAVIDHIRTNTGHDKVSVIGHTGGNTNILALMTMVPRFNRIIQPFIALAPVWTRANSPVNPVMREVIRFLVNYLRNVKGQVFPQGYIRILQKLLCDDPVMVAVVCNPVLYVLSSMIYPGSGDGSTNFDRLSIYETTGVRFSVSNWFFAQGQGAIFVDEAGMFDVNPEINMQRYGSVTPPKFDPHRITNPEMHFISAPSDLINDQTDLNLFKQQLRVKLRSELLIPINWSQQSYQDGAPDDVVDWVNTPILQILSLYS
jgi:lysosomal acid lipase/cholesteryl ester hydrolase